jgi:hypothetical protein
VGRAQRLLRDASEGPERGDALHLEQEAALAADDTAAVAASNPQDIVGNRWRRCRYATSTCTA